MADVLDFRIEVGDRIDGGYRIRVSGDGFTFSSVVPLEFDDPELRVKLSYLPTVLQSSSARSRAVTTPEESDVQFIGARLFERLTAQETLGLLAQARRAARDSGRELRLTLRIRPPELAALPWEFMYDARPHERRYLGRECLVVRDSEDATPTPPLPVAGPLRMLAMVADVEGLPRLDVAEEREQLTGALAELTGSGRVELQWAEATKDSLVGALRRGPWHVFHFIGHGLYDADAGAGRLVFEGPGGTADHVSAGQLSATLATHPSLRLAVFNACETGRGGPDAHSSVAEAMIHVGMPAIVGMQFPITDRMAPVFSRAFYEALADGEAVDQCVQAGRRAIMLASERSMEWGTPVLYQRSADGRLFAFGERPTTAAVVESQPRVDRGPEPKRTSSPVVQAYAPNRITALADVTALALGRDGGILMVGHANGYAMVHDFAKGSVKGLFHDSSGHTRQIVHEIAILCDDRHAVCLTGNGQETTGVLWAVADAVQRGRMPGARSVSAHPTAPLFAVDERDSVCLYYPGRENDRLNHVIKSELWSCPQFSRDGRLFGFLEKKDPKNIEVVSYPDFDLVDRLVSVSGAAFGLVDELVVVVDPQGSIWIRDRRGPTRSRTLGEETHQGPVKFALNNTALLATATARGSEIALWDVRTGTVLRRFPATPDPRCAPAFSADGRRLAFLTGPRTIEVWDLTAIGVL